MKLFLLFSVVLTLSNADIYETDDVKLLKSGIKQLFDSGIAPEYLQQKAEYRPVNLSLSGVSTVGNVTKQTSCELCDLVLGSIVRLRKNRAPGFVIRKIVLEGCVNFGYEDRRVCEGIVGPDVDIMLYIIDNKKNVTGEKICSLLLGSTCHQQFDYFDWSINIPEKLDVMPNKIVKKEAKNLRILQITDLHYDPRYTVGANAVCGETLCCQDDQGIPKKPEEACGVWGDYRMADTPKRTLDEMLRHTRTQDIDYVYFTGDIISHRVWSTSKVNNSNQEREVMDLLRNNFDVPVLFVLGNHEPHPVNSYAPLAVSKKNLSNKWLFDILADELKGLVSDDDLKNVGKGGFYTLVLRPGLRIIVLNNNVCYTDNLWLVYEDYDPYGQLEWLVTILEQAEMDGEYVHILHHIPTGDVTCLGAWGREFNRIINRFSDTISGQFSGHTHLDEFFLYFNESEPTEAIHVAFNGASVSTFIHNNPSYKIYDIDSQNFEVIDLEEWTFNLTSANLHPEKPTVDWYKLYTFRETYQIDSMEPRVLGEMVRGMARNKTLLEIYNKFRYRMGDGADEECDDDCHKRNLCVIVTSSLADTQHCEDIERIYDENKQL